MYILSICCLSFVDGSDNDQQEQGDIAELKDRSTDQETCQGISRDAVCTDLCCSSENINQPTVMALLKTSKRVYESEANNANESKWYKSFPWLHFCSSKSKALCFYCTKVECFNDELESRSSIYVYWIFKLEKGNSLIQRT